MKSWEEKCAELIDIREGEGACGRTDELIEIAEGIDANPICMATVTICGRQPGPRVWLEAQTHGDEPNSTEAILRVLREIDPQEVSGILVAAPAMHSAAVRHFGRESPLDGKNGNRIWNTDWTKLGHTKVFSYIWMHRVGEIIRALKPRLVIDMHDGGAPLKIMSHVLYDARSLDLDPSLHDLAIKSDMEVIWANKGGRFGGSIGDFASANDFPCIMLESGGTGQLCEPDIEEMASGLRNTLKAIGLLKGEPAPRRESQLFMVNGNWVRAYRAGLFYPEVKLGQRVDKGSTIGFIGNLFGYMTEEIKSPVDGIVFGLRHSAVADVGSYIANIGELGG